MSSYKIFVKDTKDNIIWQLDVDDSELLAGMLAAGLGIIDDLNRENNVNYYIDSDTNVSFYRLLAEVAENAVPYKTNGKLLSKNYYGIWMRGSNRFHYNLFQFCNNYFWQGIVSMCNAFQVDFRNYIYGVPFDKNGNQYALGDYVMVPYRIGQDILDLDDIDSEEETDENIIEPLARTDVIITAYDNPGDNNIPEIES